MFATNQQQELLSQYPTFEKHVDETCLNTLSKAQLVNIPAGTTIFHETSPCKNFTWLLEGNVRVFKNSEEGREVTVYRVSPGELCLLSLNGLLDSGNYPASAKNETAVKALMITSEQFHHLMDNSRGFRTYVMQSLTERLSEVISLVSDITFRRLDLRLACLLGQRFERSRGMALKITHAELACELGTTREVISRILKEFEHQQCITLSRGQIHLVSQVGLDWFTNNDKKAG